VRERLVAHGEAELLEEESLGCRQHRLVPRRAADVSVFSDDELATVERVLADLDGLSARQAGDLAREEAGWRLVELGDTIPYEAALVGAPQVSTPTSRRLERLVADRYRLLPS
jgi:hypothetical protein